MRVRASSLTGKEGRTVGVGGSLTSPAHICDDKKKKEKHAVEWHRGPNPPQWAKVLKNLSWAPVLYNL